MNGCETPNWITITKCRNRPGPSRFANAGQPARTGMIRIFFNAVTLFPGAAPVEAIQQNGRSPGCRRAPVYRNSAGTHRGYTDIRPRQSYGNAPCPGEAPVNALYRDSTGIHRGSIGALPATVPSRLFPVPRLSLPVLPGDSRFIPEPGSFRSRITHRGSAGIIARLGLKSIMLTILTRLPFVIQHSKERQLCVEIDHTANVEPALILTFGKSPAYQAGANIELALTSTFGTSPEYRAGTNVDPALTSTFGSSPEYRAGANVEPALTSTFDKSPAYRGGANIEPALTSKFVTSPDYRPALISTFGTRPKYRAGANVEPAFTSTCGTSPEYRAGENIELGRISQTIRSGIPKIKLN
ncbi:hypothetical protein DPMN_073753 [Dreissena polymorpha]|uniref:Uncharacterized protein n=1 Tax=Dreissena polymorpha TaxID=45954 RepID=A0A9D4BZQ5_DREPO|nr:hypothetical protein DPMN_073753 [Dreissena polymorpha]